MLITGISYADVVRPALDIQDMNGDTGIDLGTFNFDIDATAFTIVTTGDPIDIADTVFTLTSTSTAGYDGDEGYFSGTFSVGTSLTGFFDNLLVYSLGRADGGFEGLVSYDGGSLMGDLTGGSIVGTFSDIGMVAELGDVTVVPVPAAVWLFGSGLLGLVGVARRKA